MRRENSVVAQLLDLPGVWVVGVSFGQRDVTVDVRLRRRRLALVGLGYRPVPIIPGERGCPQWPGNSVRWDKLLFSAKESIYKAWFPLARRWLDFLEATLTIQPYGQFQARLLTEGPIVNGRPLRSFNGRWLVHQGLVVTAVTAPRMPVDGYHSERTKARVQTSYDPARPDRNPLDRAPYSPV
jgi:hypothetical protein